MLSIWLHFIVFHIEISAAVKGFTLVRHEHRSRPDAVSTTPKHGPVFIFFSFWKASSGVRDAKAIVNVKTNDTAKMQTQMTENI